MNHWREECGVFGIWGESEAARMTYLGLYAQQHRGQESAGIVTLDNEELLVYKKMGLVGDVFSEDVLESLKGHAAIGHVRYSTTGKSELKNAQPIMGELSESAVVSIAHNGNIVNIKELRKKIESQGIYQEGDNDTECFLHLIKIVEEEIKQKNSQNSEVQTNSKPLIIESLKKVLLEIKGAFSLVLLTKDGLIAARDINGFRPLVLGKRGNATVFASESCAFDLIDAKLVREVEPGEIVYINKDGEHSFKYGKSSTGLSSCVFEHVYFSRPDSIIFGKSVYKSRKRMGRILSKETKVDADLIIPVPDSGLAAAIGYSNESGIPFDLGIIRNHYVGRTFIQPSQSIRSFGVRIKLNAQTEIVKGKRVVLVDDSLVRGTTSKKIIDLVRQAGAKEVHFRVASPPTTGSCYYGVDTQAKAQLIAGKKSVQEICKFIGADTLKYLSLEGMMRALFDKPANEPLENLTPKKCGYCAACFDGQYPIEPE